MCGHVHGHIDPQPPSPFQIAWYILRAQGLPVGLGPPSNSLPNANQTNLGISICLLPLIFLTTEASSYTWSCEASLKTQINNQSLPGEAHFEAFSSLAKHSSPCIPQER